MQTLVEWLSELLSLGSPVQARLVASLLVVFVLVAVRLLLMSLVGRRIDNVTSLYRWRKILEYSALVIGLLALAQIWLIGGSSLATYLGLLSAGLAVALKDPISNVFGWLFIITRRPFEVGDRVEIDGVAGDVIDVRYFQFSMVEIGNWVDADQSTGRIIHMPNQKVFFEPLANATRGFSYIWHEIPVMVTFESDWRKAKALLLQIVTERTTALSQEARDRLKEAARRYLISYEKLTPIVYTRVAESGVVLTIRYLCDPRQRRGTEMAIWESILDAFEEDADIHFAYPTQRIYFPERGETHMTGGNEMPRELEKRGRG